MLLCATAAMSQSTQAPAPPPFFVEASDCAAAFKATVAARLTQPRSDARDKAILDDTEKGFIFIGVAYKQGLRNPEADRLLAAAEQRWSQLGKAEQAQRVASCSSRAKQLMDDVTFIERYIVKNRAQARVEQLLRKEKKA